MGLSLISPRLRYDLLMQAKSYRLGTVKQPLPTSARDIPSCVATFFRQLIPPRASAEIKPNLLL